MNANYKKIKTFAAACKELGLDAKKLIAKWTKSGDTKDEIAYKQLKIFIKAINGEWKPNWNDGSWKYYPFFWVNAAGSGFSLSRYDRSGTCTGVGSRLCCETSEQALHAAKYGAKMYKDFLL